jgi:hypothetical protein
MAVAFVNTVNGGLICDSLTLNLPAMNVVAGNAVFVVASSDSDITGVSDTAGNTWTKLADWTGALAWPFSDIWVSRITTGNASDVITVTRAAPAVGPCHIAQAYQYSGLGDVEPVVDASATGTQTAGTSVTSASFSVTGACLAIAQLLLSSNARTYTAGTNYTLRGPGSASYESAEDRIAPPTGAQTASFTIDTAADMSIQVIAVRGTHQASGTMAAAFGLSGSLTVTGDISVSGTSAAAFGLSGSLVVDKLLSGVMAMQAGLSGTLAVEGDSLLSGSIQATFGLTGEPVVERTSPTWGLFAGRGPWMVQIKK